MSVFRVKRLVAGCWMCCALLLISAVWSGGGASAQQPPGPVTISIVGTNDLHGGVLPRDGRGGLAQFGGYVSNLRAARARDFGAVLLIDAGDMFQGTLESNLGEGADVVAAYNTLGYAAAAIGNHEFDYGPVGEAATPRQPGDDPRGALKARAAEARFPFLSANLIDTATGQPVNWPNVRPSVIVEAAGVRVGIIGLATTATPATTIAANVRGLTIAPLAPTITAEATKLRAAGATVVIVTAHAGGSCTKFDNPADLTSCEADDEIMDAARAVPPGLVDVIVAGHIHQRMAHEVAGIAIIESMSNGRAFGRVDLRIDRGTGQVAGRRIFPPHEMWQEPMYEGAAITPSLAVEQALAPAVERARTLKAQPVGVVLDTPIRRSPTAESPLGNLFADLMRASVPGSDVAMSNSGGVRADLAAGPLTYGRFYEAMPFDNRLVEIRLTGAQLKKVFENNFAQALVGIPVSGIRVIGRCESGALHVALVRLSGAQVRDDESLEVVTNDFIASGGDRILSPLGDLQSTDVPGQAVMRDAMVAQLRKRGGHLKDRQLLNAKRPRIAYPGKPPIQCG
jgi:2',3'-cyclic-nucleotide 2'-phosphodiesterase (5'-nucleotidase family)